jgi:hypothetical protein
MDESLKKREMSKSGIKSMGTDAKDYDERRSPKGGTACREASAIKSGKERIG